MSLPAQALLDQLSSHAQASGYFDRVNTHEPKNPPGNGMTCAIWMQSLGRAPRASGLSATAALVTFTVRVYLNFVQEPQDQIDPDVLAAVDYLLGAYSGDFELGGNARCVDLLGQTGVSLGAQAGYLNFGGQLMRVVDVTVPIIVNDLWSQSP